MRLNTPEDALATDGLMLDLVRRHLDSSSEERLRWSQLLKKRYLLRKVVLVYLHTLASHNVDHREWPYPIAKLPANHLAKLTMMLSVRVSREWRSSHDPRSFRKRRRGWRADTHVSARADTDSIQHGEHAVENILDRLDAAQHLRGTRRKDNAGKLLTRGPEDLQTVLSRVINVSYTSLLRAQVRLDAVCGLLWRFSEI